MKRAAIIAALALVAGSAFAKCDDRYLGTAHGCAYQNRAGETGVLWDGPDTGRDPFDMRGVTRQPVKPAAPVFRDQYGRPAKSPLQICKESRDAGNPVTPYCYRTMYGEGLGHF